MRKIKILKKKEDEYQNNNKNKNVIGSNKYNIDDNNIDNNFISSIINKDTEISPNDNIFCRYNNNSCWLDCFLFIFKYLVFNNIHYSNDLQKLNLDKSIEEFLNDISTITDISIFNLGIWNYILTNNNYSDDILCSKDNIKNKSSFCSLFKMFQNSNEFCISYKRMFHCNI